MAAAIMAAAAGAVHAWEGPGPIMLGAGPETSVLPIAPDDDEALEQPQAIRQTSEWRFCVDRLDAGDIALKQEMRHVQKTLGLNGNAARHSVLTVCANDILSMGRGPDQDDD